MASQPDAEMGGGRYPARNRTPVKRLLPTSEDTESLGQGTSKRQKTNRNSSVSRESPPASKSKVPAELSSSSPVQPRTDKNKDQNIEQFLTSGKPGGPEAQVGKSGPPTPPTEQSSAAEDVVNAGKTQAGGKPQAKETKPDGGKPRARKPRIVKPKVIKPKVTKPKVVEPEVVEPEVVESEDESSEVVEPNFVESEDESSEDEGTKQGSPKKKNEDPRPLPSGEPPVWARGRQAICDSLNYFRANNSAAYVNGGICRGFLVDGGGGLRSYMDSEIIITRAGGGCKTKDGKTTQEKNHDFKNATVQAIMNNMKTQTPIAMIAGKNNDACPVQLPHRYCVLGWFVVAKVWIEKEMSGKQGVEVIKYRFEKLNLEERSWWIKEGSSETSPMIPKPVAAPAQECPGCKETHTQIYEQKWTCLKQGCKNFHSIVSASNNSTLTYSKDFLSERRPIGLKREPAYELVPAHVSNDDMGEVAINFYSRGMWKGFVCPKCHGCNPKKFFDRLECLTKTCDYVNRTRMPLMTHKNLLPAHAEPVYGHAICLNQFKPVVSESSYILGGWVINTYKFSDNDYVTHLQANRFINAAPNSSDELLVNLQIANLNLERFPRRQGGDKKNLSNNFVKNYGLPYNYVVQVTGSGFNEAPEAVLYALRRLAWAGKIAIVSGDCKKFNEILTVGYMEKGEMTYHDDGEKDLGPTVASLNLGSPATMFFRMKSKYYTGVTVKKEEKDKPKTYYPKAPVPEGAWRKEEREKFNAEHGHLDTAKTKHEFEVKWQELYKTFGRRPGECSPLVTLKLAHGDIVVQHGCNLQKLYEHEVANDGSLRFALTARHINPECKNAKGKHHLAEYEASAFPDYDGK